MLQIHESISNKISSQIHGRAEREFTYCGPGGHEGKVYRCRPYIGFNIIEIPLELALYRNFHHAFLVRNSLKKMMLYTEISLNDWNRT